METQTFSKEEKEEIIRYGLDRIKSICTMTFVTLLMGCIFQVFFQSIIFLVCFIALRKYAGGYHADTQNRCYVISTAIIAVALLAIRYMSDGSDNEIFILLQSLNFILLYFLVPVDNKNHCLEYWEKEKYGKKSKSENRVYVCAMYLFEFYRDKKHSHYSWSNKSDCWRMCDCRKNKKFCIKQSANIKS